MKRLIKNLLARLGYRISGTRYIPRQLLQNENLRILDFDDLVCRRICESGPELTFIQVGAFDGLLQDPLRKYIGKYPWRGIMIEPQARAAERLRNLYAGNGRIVVIQAALDGQARQRTLYTLDPQRAPAWAGALASFQRQHILKHADGIPNINEMILEELVDCVTFGDVLSKMPAVKVDILQIDTEGADAHVLSLFPFQQVRPAIVHWEIRHLSLKQKEGCLDRLATFGYRFASYGDQDMIAVQF
jgi:FkbM family methyltransferase